MEDHTETIEKLRATGSDRGKAMALLIENGFLTALHKTIEQCKGADISAQDYVDAYVALTAIEVVAFASGYPNQAVMIGLTLKSAMMFQREIEAALTRVIGIRAETEAKEAVQ